MKPQTIQRVTPIPRRTASQLAEQLRSLPDPAGFKVPPMEARRSPSEISQEQGAVPSSGRLASVDLSLIPTLAVCSPGFAPTEYNVLIAPPDKAEKTEGGLFLADETKDADFMAAQLGRLVAASPIAFNYDDDPAWRADQQPQLGDIVWFARYAGTTLEGLDGRTYRIVKDRDIGGIVRSPV